MKNGFFRLELLLMVPLWGPGFAHDALAEMNYLEMKGIHALFTEECENLSPIYGFTALKTGILPNIRFFGNYGPEKEQFPCHTQIRNHQRQKDCPQDYSTSLIQQLFPSPDGFSFVANQSSQDDPISHLTPELIGKLLAKIHNPGNIPPNLGDELTLLIYEELYGKVSPVGKNYEILKASVDIKVARAHTLRGEIENCKNDASTGSKVEGLIIQLNEIQNNLAKSANTIQSQIQKEIAQVKKTKNWKALTPFTNTLIGALQEAKREKSDYPQNNVEQSLFGYFLKKANHKEDFLRLLRGMPSCIKKDEQSWVTATDPHFASPRKTEWLQSKYSLKDYNDWKSHFHEHQPTPSQIAEIQHDPEAFAFHAYSYEVFDRLLPTLPDYANAAHKSLGKPAGNFQRKYNTYADCGETSVRSFFNIVLYDRDNNRFSSERLQAIADENQLQLYSAPGKKKEKGLLPFYQRNPNVDAVESEEARDDWSRRVISNLKSPVVNYLKPSDNPVCEMNAGNKNVLAVMENLLGDRELKTLATPAEKWDRICELFSRENFELDWNVKNGSKEKVNHTNTGIELEFTINGDPAFVWAFEEGHFFISDSTDAKRDWRTSVALPSLPDHSKRSRDVARAERLLPWVLKPGNLKEVFQRLPQTSLLWGLPLRSNESKLQLIDVAFQYAPGAVSFLPVLKRWIREIPTDDLQGQVKIYNAILNGNHEASFASEVQVAKNKIAQERSAALFLCASHNLAALLRNFGASGADLLQRNDSGMTLLQVAARSDSELVARELLRLQPQLLMDDALAKNSNGNSPIHIAAATDALSVLKLLETARPELLSQPSQVTNASGQTPLHMAAIGNSINVVDYLLADRFRFLLGTPQLAKDWQGRTPLHLAAINGSTDVALKFIRKHPELLEHEALAKDNEGLTPLHLAAEKGDEVIVRELLRSHPKLLSQEKLARNKEGKTPMQIASAEEQSGVVKILAESPLTTLKEIQTLSGTNPDDEIKSILRAEIKKRRARGER
jgi:ankyrin repeat protein